MTTSQISGPSWMGCAHCATCSCKRRESLNIESDDDSDIESVTAPSLSEGNYDPKVWSLSRSISTINSSDVDVDDIMLSGVGLLVGKAMFAFGKAQLRAVESLWIRYRRALIQRALSRRIGHLKKGTSRMLDDLVSFTQDGIYGWNLKDWSRDTLFNQIKLGSGHEVARALRRAPTTLGMHALDDICHRVDFMDLNEQLIDAMAQVTKGWFRYTDKNDSPTSQPQPTLVSRICTHAIVFSSDELQLYKHIRGSVQINYCILHWFAIYVSPEGNVASRTLWRLECLQGRDHPDYIKLEYLIRGNQLRHGMDDDTLRGCALSMCLRMHRLYSHKSQEESEGPWPVDSVHDLATTLKYLGCRMEEEVIWRFYIAVHAHAYEVPNRARNLRLAFSVLEDSLYTQGGYFKAYQCHKFVDPLRAICYPPSLIAPPTKAKRLSHIRRLDRLRRSNHETIRDEEESQTEDLEQLFAEFNPENDTFLRNIAAGLDEEMQEYLWELTEAKRSSGGDDFYTAHECSSDCEHDYGSEDEDNMGQDGVGQENQDLKVEDEGEGSNEGMDKEELKKDANDVVEKTHAETADDE